MHRGIPIAFGGGGDQVLGSVLTGQLEDIKGSHRSYAERLDAVLKVVEGTRRRREMKHIVEAARIERHTNIVLKKIEAGLIRQLGNILHLARNQIVDAQDTVTFR